MKTIARLVMVAGVACALALGTAAYGSGALKSFNTTNYISSAVAYVTGFPTNFPGTNGLPTSTGLPVDISQTRGFAVNIQGFLRNTNATGSLIFLEFLPSLNSAGGIGSGGRPSVLTGTNVFLTGTNVFTFGVTTIVDNDFSDTNQIFRLTVPVPALTTNYFNWSTNFTGLWPPGDSANWIGIYGISNNFTAGNFLTNVNIGVNTKLIPTPMIGE